MDLKAAIRRATLVCVISITTAFGLSAHAAARDAGHADDKPATAIDGWRGSASGAYLAGRFAEQQLDYSRAADFFQRVLAEDPGNLELRLRVLLLLTSEGRFEEALEQAKVLAGAGDVASFAQLTLAVEEMRKEEFASAEQMLEAMGDERYNAFIKPAGIAWARIGQGDLAGAREALAALSENPGFATLRRLHEALQADVAGDEEAAAAAYRAVLGGEERPPLRIAQHATNFFIRNGDEGEAQRIYDLFVARGGQAELIELPEAEDESLEPIVADAADGFAEVLFNLAGALYDENDTESALIYARLASALRPEGGMIHLLVGEILETQGRHEEAIAVYDEVEPGPTYGRAARMRIARSLDEKGRTDEAVELLRELAADDPQDPEPLIQLGHILRGHERFEEAVEVYDEAMSRMEGAAANAEAGLLYARGIALERSNRWERAEKDLLAALEVGGDQAYVLNYLGYSWVDRGMHMERAEEMIRKAVELRPQDGFIADSLGWVYYKTGRYAKAVAELERAVALEPQDPVINEHLGDAYWKVGRTSEARFQWARALQMEPAEKRIVDLQAKVQCGLDGCSASREARGGSL